MSELLTVREVAELLNVDENTVYRAIRLQRMAHVRLTVRSIRVTREAVADYVAACTVPAK